MRSLLAIYLFLMILTSCDFEGKKSDFNSEEAVNEEVEFFASLNEEQFQELGMKVGALQSKTLYQYIETNGLLMLPPQSEAVVTTQIGANILSIRVIEGQKVNKGEVLATMAHPDLIELQTDYVDFWSQLLYLEEEFERQKKLNEEEVTSDREFKKVQSEYLSLKAMVKGHEAQLSLIGVSPEKLQNGEVYSRVNIVSPISGHVSEVNIRIGQYAMPIDPMFRIVHTDHIHGHFNVFEKDILKVNENQKVILTVEANPNRNYEGYVFNVGKVFEDNPKAVNIHTEINNADGQLLPGMYARGKIVIDSMTVGALPQDAVVREGDRFYIFKLEEPKEEHESWHFWPVEVIPGIEDRGWIEISGKTTLGTSLYALNNAYYLLAEMQKSEFEE